MFSLGLGLTLGDFQRIFTMPRAVLTGAVCQILIVPIIAFLMVTLIKPPAEIAVGIMILSFCPGGVVSNIMTKLAGGTVALSITLTATISLLSVLTLPIFVNLAAHHFMNDSAPTINTLTLGLTMFAITAFPASIGIAFRHYAPARAIAIEPIIVRVANTLFVLIVLASIASGWDLLVANFLKLGPSLIAINIILFGIGLFAASLAKLHQRDRICIAIETGFQNSALGITIGSLVAASAAGVSAFSLPSGVYGVTSYAVAFPFILWARKQTGKPSAQ